LAGPGGCGRALAVGQGGLWPRVLGLARLCGASRVRGGDGHEGEGWWEWLGALGVGCDAV